MQLTEADKRTLLDTRKKRKAYVRTEEAYEEEKAAYLTAQKLTGIPTGLILHCRKENAYE